MSRGKPLGFYHDDKLMGVCVVDGGHHEGLIRIRVDREACAIDRDDVVKIFRQGRWDLELVSQAHNGPTPPLTANHKRDWALWGS